MVNSKHKYDYVLKNKVVRTHDNEQRSLRAKREYMREYRRKNRERMNKKLNEWKKNNPEKVKQYEANYWERKAEQMERAAN